MSLILLRNVCKSYGEKLLFENVNLNINSEDKVGLIGKNGAGKTTLIKIMLGLEGSSGEIIAEKFEYSYFKQIEDLNPEELTLKFVLEKDIYDSAKVESVNQFCRGLGLDCSLLYRNVGTLSGGEKAKIFIIKSILNNPDLIILDEPTNHINFRHIPIIIEAINRYDGAMILISHMPDFVEKIRIDDYLDLGNL